MNDLTHPGRSVEAPARFTTDEFLKLADTMRAIGAGKLELVEGVIVRMSPAQAPHMYYQRQLFLALHRIFGGERGGRIVQFELSMRIGDGTLRAADVGVVEAFAPEAGRFADPADVLLVVEIAHASLDYDKMIKRFDYARAGIPHYWVVDVDKRRVHVMAIPLDGDYAERHPVAFGELLPVPETDLAIVID